MLSRSFLGRETTAAAPAAGLLSSAGLLFFLPLPTGELIDAVEGELMSVAGGSRRLLTTVTGTDGLTFLDLLFAGEAGEAGEAGTAGENEKTGAGDGCVGVPDFGEGAFGGGGSIKPAFNRVNF